MYRIQYLHNISYEAMVSGQLKPHLPASPHRLNWMDCFNIATAAKKKNDLVKTVEWMKVVVDLAEKSKDVKEKTLEFLRQKLYKSTSK